MEKYNPRRIPVQARVILYIAKNQLQSICRALYERLPNLPAAVCVKVKRVAPSVVELIDQARKYGAGKPDEESRKEIGPRVRVGDHRTHQVCSHQQQEENYRSNNEVSYFHDLCGIAGPSHGQDTFVEN